MFEREQARDRATTDDAEPDVELAPGRINRTSRLIAPRVPIASLLVMRKVTDVALGSSQPTHPETR